MRRPWLLALPVPLVLAMTSAQANSTSAPPTPPPPTSPLPAQTGGAPPLCLGDYAEDWGSLNAESLATDSAPDKKYSYCVRNTAVYECVSYGSDGSLKKVRRTATLHGTAFGYRRDDADTLLLTNTHVAEWPSVTDDEHPVEGVPTGCKKITETIKLVDDERDDYAPDDTVLVRVVADPQLDVAVLRAHAHLEIIPWKVGRSAPLHERDVVEVKGFPLGAFQATNVGKVVSAYDHDEYKEWDHDDFVVDALLSAGNSGSPVLAVSCKTGELELVGIFHAAYSGGSALNVVVGIDQVRDLMSSLKRVPRVRPDAVALDGAARNRLAEEVRGGEQYFPFGSLMAMVHIRPDGALVFAIYPHDFPLSVQPLVVLEDLAPFEPAGFGTPGRVLAGGTPGLKRYLRADLDADAQAQTARVLDGLRRAALSTFDWRAAAKVADISRDAFERASRLSRTVNRSVKRQGDLTQMAADLADRLGPHAGQPVTSLAELVRAP
jgi:serine protease Do